MSHIQNSLHLSKYIIMAAHVCVELSCSCSNLYQSPAGFRSIVCTGVVSNGINCSNGHLLTGAGQAP